MTLDFFIAGIPAPGGSKRGFPIRRKNGTVGVAITEDCTRSAPWRAVVQLAAQEVRVKADWLLGFLDYALVLDVTFYMPRPKSHFTSKGLLRPTAPVYPTKKPDRTKLLRLLEDSCTGVLWHDDAQIVDGGIRKLYADPYNPPGARVIVMRAREA